MACRRSVSRGATAVRDAIPATAPAVKWFHGDPCHSRGMLTCMLGP